MAEIIALNELAAKFAEKTGLSEQEAVDFITTYFRQAADALAAGTELSIPDLGTLSVNDGEVDFIPNQSLAERINEPFSIFSPVEMEDDVDLSDIDDEKDVAEDIPPVKDEPQPVTIEEEKPEEPVKPATPPPFDVYRFNSLKQQYDISEQHNTAYDEYADAEDESPSIRKRIILWAVIALLSGLIIGGIIGYLGHDSIAKKFAPCSSEKVEIKNTK